MCENSTIASYDRDVELKIEFHKWFNHYHSKCLDLIFKDDISFNDEALKVVTDFLNDDYGDLDVCLQDDSIVSEAACNVINECIRPYISYLWVDELFCELEKVIVWGIRSYFGDIYTNVM